MPKSNLTNRDDQWLLARLDHLWSNHFSDVLQTDPLFIKFGRFARFRLGSIRLDKVTKRTYITITAMFKDTSVSQAVVDWTIAHELCHYAHGFSSYLPKLHKYPHEGGVVNRELKNRRLGHLAKEYQQWMKEYKNKLKVKS